MVQRPNYIELNGKRYDALTGALLATPPPTKTVAKKPFVAKAKVKVKVAAKPAKAVHRHSGTSMDGFTKAKVVPVAPQDQAAKTATQAPTATAAAMRPAGPARPISDFVTHNSHHLHSGPAKGNTLMRHAVTKPAPSLKRHTKVQQRTDVLVKQPSITVAPKLSSYSLDPHRVAHAKQVQRSPQVSRYALDHHLLVSKEHRTIAANATQAASHQVAVKPVYAAASADVMRAPAAPQAPSMDIFERALARANSHLEQPHARKAKRRKDLPLKRALNIAAASLAVLLLVAFFGWQNRTNISMHYAASKAGVAATMPGYKPAGFHAGTLSYSSGKVALNFSNDEGQSFALVESSSNWDSQALRDSFVAMKSRTFQTIQAAGRTIYSYGDNNATWVDHGVWYQINSHGSLTTNQLVQLAVSM